MMHNLNSGALIVNADDFGRDRRTTDCTMDCVRCGTVSSVSAMVFMQDSEHAAQLAAENNIDAGIHLNLTTPFTATACPARVVEHQRRIAAYLRRHPLGRLVYHPGLSTSFQYCVRAQFEEFESLYHTMPTRIDGHHHMHLCANMLFSRLLPPGSLVRRNLFFPVGEKGVLNRIYRMTIDQVLALQFKIVDRLYNLAPIERCRLGGVFSAARRLIVELETHPARDEEYRFLTGGDLQRFPDGIRIRSFSSLMRESAPVHVRATSDAQ